MNQPNQTRPEQRLTAHERFWWAFFVGAVPTFLSVFLLGSASFASSAIFATLAGLLCATLAALFGKRVMDFLMDFPW
jgi:hypothetical protein